MKIFQTTVATLFLLALVGADQRQLRRKVDAVDVQQARNLGYSEERYSDESMDHHVYSGGSTGSGGSAKGSKGSKGGKGT